MSQRTEKKRRLTLQIISVSLVLAFVGGCTATPQKTSHQTIPQSNALGYVKTIKTVGIGNNDVIKRLFAGDETLSLNQPMAIDLRDDIMIIADRGRIFDFAELQATLSEDQLALKKTLPNAENRLVDQSAAVASAQVRVADHNRGVIFKFDLKSGRMTILHSAGDVIKDEISDVHMTKDHSFYVTDVGGRRVLHFSPNGKLLKEFKDAPNIFRPIAVTVDEEKQEVLVADETYSHIVSFDMRNGEPLYGMGDRGNGPGKFRIITDMIAIPDGYLVSDRIELRVQVLDKEGNYIADFGRSELMFPTALAMDKYGRVYVSDKSDSTINVFKAGKLIEKIGSNGYGPVQFRYISDMKIHRDQLYVVDSLNGRIQVFNIIPEASSVASVN